jgi:putative DNA methylase
MPGIGPHPKGIHHWWARLPLPTARAVLFASVVDDPSAHPERFPTEEAQNLERERLFGILRRMMQKKLHEHPEIYAEARQEMLKHCDGKLPPILDPFAGGGSIPLEGNRLGFEAHAADLNPVAVLLNKCNLEIVPRWTDHSPINPEARDDKLRKHEWKGARGLAEDVRYYGRLVHQRAIEKIGHLSPKVKLPKEYGGREANVIAWIWARTVASPNPAAKMARVPLLRSYWLSNKKGTEAYVKPIIDKESNTYIFTVHRGTPTDSFQPSRGTVKKKEKGGTCLLYNIPIPFDYIRTKGKEGQISTRLMAIVAEGSKGRLYVSPTREHEQFATFALPNDYPDTDIPEKALGFRVQLYGVNKHYKLFTPRQLTAMVSFSDMIKEIRTDVLADARNAGVSEQNAEEYSKAITTFLALALDRCADFNNSLCTWNSSNQKVMHLFGRQTIPMVWDFVEANILGDSVGAWSTCNDYVADCAELIGGWAKRWEKIWGKM